ncbi:MAG: protoporphyrinogen oxidase HemJ [Anderseniella sp.]
MTHEWIKVIHVLAVISWMAGLLYLPRLMVYHAGASANGELSETLKIMERRLLKAIMTPAMIVSWIFGIWLAVNLNLWSDLQVWFLVKLICIIAMTFMHFWLAGQVKLFAADSSMKSAKTFRIANEVPTVLMIVIVIMVIVKPW